MGFFSKVKGAASAAVGVVTKPAVDAAKAIVHNVEAAGATASKGAKQALRGVSHLPAKAKQAVGKVAQAGATKVRHVADAGRRIGRSAVRQARAGARLVRSGAKEVAAVASRGATRIKHDAVHAARDVRHAAAVSGRWAWDHKAEIGFYAATTAMMLAIPVTGGASGAAAGGLMAARAAAIAARLGGAGRMGLAAARLGSAAVQSARGTVLATRAGGAVARLGGAAGTAGHGVRVGLGNRAGVQALVKLKGPVNAIGTVASGAHLGDTTAKYARGEASAKDLALASLGFGAASVGSVRSGLGVKARFAERKAANLADQAATDISSSAQLTRRAADPVSRAAAHHPRAAAAADDAAHLAATADQEAAALVRQAQALRAAKGKVDVDDGRGVVQSLDAAAERLRTARASATAAAQLAPSELSAAANASRLGAHSGEQMAVQARERLAALLDARTRADRAVESSRAINDSLDATSLHANIVNNTRASTRPDGTRWQEGAVARGLATAWLTRNARVHEPTPGAG